MFRKKIRIVQQIKYTKDTNRPFETYFAVYRDSQGERATISLKLCDKALETYKEKSGDKAYLDVQIIVRSSTDGKGASGYHAFTSYKEKLINGKYIRVRNKEDKFIPQMVITNLDGAVYPSEPYDWANKPDSNNAESLLGEDED